MDFNRFSFNCSAPRSMFTWIGAIYNFHYYYYYLLYARGLLYCYHVFHFSDLIMQTDDGCSSHKFIISFNMLLCIGFSIVSILPKVQEGRITPRLPLPWLSIISYQM